MSVRTVSKIVISIVITILLSIADFITWFIAMFTAGQKFYAPLVIIVTIFMILFSILVVFKLLKRTWLKRIAISFISIVVIAICSFEISRMYKESITVMSSQDTDLSQYWPFVEHTKAVKLNEPSSLNITENLPMIDGSTALYPLYSSFVQAVYPENEYLHEKEVVSTQTNGAYSNLIKGTVDIIFTFKPSEQQLEEAKKLGVELKLTPIGKEAFIFFVNSKNDVRGLSTNQIQDIYTGFTTNWKDVGGKYGQIKAFQRPENSGSQTMLKEIMDGKYIMSPPREDVIAGMGAMVEQTSNYRNYKNAIGYSFLFYATEMIHNGEIQLLEIDGVFPNKESIRNGTYPFTTEIYAVTAGSQNPNVEPFIEWILSPQGQYLVEKTGYTRLIE